MKHNALFTLMLILFAAATANATEMQVAVRSISVVGTAKEELDPNQAVLSGQLESRANQLSAAKAENDKMVERVLAVIGEFDIPKHDVKASNVSIAPQYTYNKQTREQELTGYIVRRQLSITMDKVGIHERVLSALVAKGIDKISHVSFHRNDMEKREDTLRLKAVADAKAKATALAEAAGAKLGKVMTIHMQGASPPPVVMRGAMMEASMASDKSVAPSLPGQITLSESIVVTYELE